MATNSYEATCILIPGFRVEVKALATWDENPTRLYTVVIDEVRINGSLMASLSGAILEPAKPRGSVGVVDDRTLLFKAGERFRSYDIRIGASPSCWRITISSAGTELSNLMFRALKNVGQSDACAVGDRVAVISDHEWELLMY